MKILHCADIHLDSPMTTNLDSKRAKELRYEFLLNFKKMAAYADANGISVIIIAGDLFDSDYVAANTRDEVINLINRYKDITFCYLEGNHDCGSFVGNLDNVPANLVTFGNSWTTYELDEKVCITGMELRDNSFASIKQECNSLKLDKNKYNIVVLHGDANLIGMMKDKGIDYLALGHIHKMSEGRLDTRGKYVYPGCLMARGFDEVGCHGFIVLDTNNGGSTEFIKTKSRRVYDLTADISGAMDVAFAMDIVMNCIDEENVSEEDMLRLTLTGKLDVNSTVDMAYMERDLAQNFYAFKLVDNTSFIINPEQYIDDISLKGEFVRNVLSSEDINEEDKAKVIRIGIRALSGEDIISYETY